MPQLLALVSRSLISLAKQFFCGLLCMIAIVMHRFWVTGRLAHILLACSFLLILLLLMSLLPIPWCGRSRWVCL